MSDEPVSSIGSSLEELLTETDQREEVYGEAIKRVLVWQIEQSRQVVPMSKTAMAERMGTSRTQVERVLDPENVTVSLETLDKAARAVGKRIKVQLVDL